MSSVVPETEEGTDVAVVAALRALLQRLVPVLLDEASRPSSLSCGPLAVALESGASTEALKKFTTEAQVRTLLLERLTGKDDVAEEEEKESVSYHVSIDVLYKVKSTSILLIKRGAVIDVDKPISGQLRVMTLSEDSPYETLHAYISSAMAPFFKSYIRNSGKADRISQKVVDGFG